MIHAGNGIRYETIIIRTGKKENSLMTRITCSISEVYRVIFKTIITRGEEYESLTAVNEWGGKRHRVPRDGICMRI